MSRSTVVGRVERNIIRSNIGKIVNITLMDDQEIKGTIVDFDRHTLLVLTAAGKTLLLFKHSVRQIDEE